MSHLAQNVDYQTVWRLAGPNIISNILFVAVTFAHLAIVAPLGSEASAALVAGSRVQFLMMSAAMALSVATTALVSRAWGGKDAKAASAATSASLMLALIIALALSLVVYGFGGVFVDLFSLTGDARTLALEFIRVVALVNPVFALVLIFAMALRAIGEVNFPMHLTGVSNILAIILSFWFVEGGYGIAPMGLNGVLWAWTLGQGIAMLVFLGYWLRPACPLRFDIKALFDTRLLGDLLRIGLPAALEQMMLQISFLAFMALIAQFGNAAFAAYGIGISVLSVCIVVGLGFGTASATLTGQALGAEDELAARDSGWATMRLAAASMAMIAVATAGFRDPLAALLSQDVDIQALTASFILILAVVQPLMGIEFALGGALRGAGDTRYPLFVTIMGNIVARFSLGAIMLWLGAPIEAMYAVIIGDYITKAILLISRFRGRAWIAAAKAGQPSAIPSIAGLSRAAVRLFYQQGRDKRRSP